MNQSQTYCQLCNRRNVELMFSNNPLVPTAICFDCIKQNLNYNNIEHADFFCRTYNLPFQPEAWLAIAETYQDETFKVYTETILSDESNKPNLRYSASTKDLWARTNREWEKCRSFAQALSRIAPIKESYIERGWLKWGEQYTFEELIKLDGVYSKTIKANNITNPMQKEAVKTLCKLQIEMDEAIRAKDPKAIKDFSSAYSTFAKQADLENMINESKTDDITTVAELFQYMEDQGFIFKFHDGYDRDEVDRAITDIQDANRRLILESTGLQPLLEDMLNTAKRTKEEEYARNVAMNDRLADLTNLAFDPLDSENAIDTETDDEALAAANSLFGAEEFDRVGNQTIVLTKNKLDEEVNGDDEEED